VIAAATAGLPAGAKKLLKHIEAKARALPSLAAMKTTKLQDADCANKDVYEMILGKFTGLAANLTRDKVCLRPSVRRSLLLLLSFLLPAPTSLLFLAGSSVRWFSLVGLPARGGDLAGGSSLQPQGPSGLVSPCCSCRPAARVALLLVSPCCSCRPAARVALLLLVSPCCSLPCTTPARELVLRHIAASLAMRYACGGYARDELLAARKTAVLFVNGCAVRQHGEGPAWWRALCVATQS